MVPKVLELGSVTYGSCDSKRDFDWPTGKYIDTMLFWLVNVFFPILNISHNYTNGSCYPNFTSNDSKSPQVYRTLLSILAHLKSAVVWMISILSLIFSSTSLFSRPLEAIPRIGIAVTFVLQMFFFFSVLWQDPGICLSYHFFFHFHSIVCWNGKLF